VLATVATLLIGNYRIFIHADDFSGAVLCTFATLDAAFLVNLKLDH
jgi:hypothetical protein